MPARYLMRKMILILLLTCCSVLHLQGTAKAQSSDQVRDEMFRAADSLKALAESSEASLLAPKKFEKADEYYKRAVKDYEKQSSLKKIRESIELAEEYYREAVENSAEARDFLDDALALRKSAMALEINESAPGKFKSAEKKLKSAALEVGKDKFSSAAKKAEKAREGYRRAAIETMREDYLDDAFQRLKIEKKNIFKDTYKKAKNQLESIEEYLKYQSKTDFDLKELYIDTYNKIAEALQTAEIEYPPLEIGGQVLAESPAIEEKEAPQAEVRVLDQEAELDSLLAEQVGESKEQVLPQMDQELLDFHQNISSLLSPSTRENIEESTDDFESRAFTAATEEDLYNAAATTAQEMFDNSKLGVMNIDEASFLVLMASVRKMDDDLSTIREQISAMDDTRAEIQSMREYLMGFMDDESEAGSFDEEQLSKNRYKVEDKWERTENLGLEYIRAPRTELRDINKIEKRNIPLELKSLENLKTDIDRIAEIDSIKLKRAEDRREKYVSTMKTILEKRNSD